MSLLLSIFFACEQPLQMADSGVLSVGHRDLNTGQQGFAEVDFQLDEDGGVIQLVAEAESGELVFVNELVSPSERVVFDASQFWSAVRFKTSAMTPRQVVTLNWPSAPSDGALESGRWRVQFGVIETGGRYVSGASLGVTLYRRPPSVNPARLSVRLILPSSLERDTRLAVDRAVAYWTQLYAEHGLMLDISEGSHPYDVLSWNDGEDSAVYRQLASESLLGQVNVIFVQTVVDMPGIYGVSGGIPGPLTQTSASAVLLSLSVNAGVDGIYDLADSRLLGETMAHEVGHYLGLFHPVEANWIAWDALDDTDECSSQVGCEELLGRNLMFPYPICDFSTCEVQDSLSSQQVQQALLYVGVHE